MAAPTFVADYPSAFNSTADKTASVTTALGDILAILAAAENGVSQLNLPTGGTPTYANREHPTSDGSDPEVRIDTAVTGITAQTFTLTQTDTGTAPFYGFDCFRFADSDGEGASESAVDSATGAPTLDITTTQDNSAILVVVCDWNAIDGATRTWRTVNGIAPSAGNGFERVYFRDGARYTVYMAYYPDAGAAGTKTVGLTTPSTMLYQIAAVEIKGTGAAAPGAPLIHCYEIASGTADSVTITKPTSGSTAGPDGAKNVAAGDYLLAVLANDDTAATTTWTPPDGTWTQIATGDVGNATSDAHCTAFIRKMDGTEGSSFTFTQGVSVGLVGCLILLSGVHQTQADALNGEGADVIDGTPPIAITGFTAGVASVLALAIYCYDGADDGGYGVSGTDWLELLEMRRGTAATGESGGVAYRKMSGIAATGTVTITPGVSDGMAGVQFGIAPSELPSYRPTGLRQVQQTVWRM